jgi:hypothetical protein
MKDVVREVKDAITEFVNKEFYPISPTITSNGERGARTLQLLSMNRDIIVLDRSAPVAEQPRVKELEEFRVVQSKLRRYQMKNI